MCIDKLDDIVIEYNNAYHRTIEMNPTEVKDNKIIHILTILKNLMIKILKLKLVIMLEYEDTKTLFLKEILQIGLKKIFVIKEVQNTVSWTYVINDFNGKEIIGTLYEKELQKTKIEKEKSFRIEEVIKRKRNKLYVKWKVYDNSFNSWIDKNDLV